MRRPEMPTVTRFILALPVLAAVALAAGWGYQRIAELQDNRSYSPPGKLHPVNGVLMHIRCRGSGSPTVIVEQGIGGPSLDWNEINERMSSITRVCDYDRAGMGYSEPAYKPTLSIDVARNLNTLLHVAKINDDLVFVGWSAGGMYAREYYRQFPARVKGMVLVDSAHERQSQRMPSQPSNQANLNRLRHSYYLAQIGWLRLTGQIERQFANSSLPEQDRKRLIAIFEKSHTYRTLLDEGVGFELDLSKGATPPTLGDLPVIVIAEGKPRHPYMQENLAVWHDLQRELADLSTDSRFVVAEDSAHFIHRSEPEVILRSVSDVVEAARTGHQVSAEEPGSQFRDAAEDSHNKPLQPIAREDARSG